MDDVFLAYSREDTPSIESIVRRLSEHGHSVWWDRRLHYGEDFGDVIQVALTASRCAVVAWSRFAQHSLWVRAEANAAMESGKLVQLTLDGTKPPLPFSMLHTLDFKTDDGTLEAPPMRELAASVAAVVAGTPAYETPSGPTWKTSLAGFASTAMVGGASIGLVVLASALAGMAPYLASPNAFGLVTTAMFLSSVLGLAHMLVRVIQTFVASSQR